MSLFIYLLITCEVGRYSSSSEIRLCQSDDVDFGGSFCVLVQTLQLKVCKQLLDVWLHLYVSKSNIMTNHPRHALNTCNFSVRWCGNTMMRLGFNWTLENKETSPTKSNYSDLLNVYMYIGNGHNRKMIWLSC